MGTKIIGTGSYVPKKVVSNTQLESIMDTSDEWIKTRTGITQRYISEEEDTSVLCGKAAMNALEKTGIDPKELGFIIVATMTPDYSSPSTACLVQEYIGAGSVMAFDINAACSGFVYALSVADKLLATGDFRYGLVLGGETMSKIIDWSDRSTAVLFGDGAGSILLEKSSDHAMLLQEDIHADGSRNKALTASKQTLKNPFSSNAKKVCTTDLQMEGRAIFDFALRNVSHSIKKVTEMASIDFSEVTTIICHQANVRILQGIAKKLKLPIEQFATNISQYGNTSAASIPILLNEWIEKEQLTLGSGEKIILTGFGGGLTWGSLLIEL